MQTETSGLRVAGLSCAYGKNAVLRGLDLEVGPGEVVGLIGRNGAGKTTTLRSISGATARGGLVEFNGEKLRARPQRAARAGIAHVPEGRRLIGSLTVVENLRVSAIAAKQPLGATEMAGVLDVFPRLRDILDRRADVLSGGEQQMVALARGLVARPLLMLVDELSLGLAPIVVDEAWKALLRLRKEEGLSILIVDQNIGTVERHCDRIYELVDGKTRVWQRGSAVVL